MPTRAAEYQAPAWLPGGDLQTVYPYLFAAVPQVDYRRERWELPDGDFIDLDWSERGSGPIVIVLHGLEGSSDSPYARGLMRAIEQRSWRGVVMHFRGCSGEPNRLARSYHSGDTGDIDFLVRTLKAREPNTPLTTIGYSLGGNALLKWLSEKGHEAPVQSAVAVSVPFLLHESTLHMQRGFARVYQWHLLKSLKRNVLRKVQRFTLPARADEIQKMKTFYEFDDRITGPLHGFKDAMHYYTSSSSRQYLKRIRIPTLIVHAHDDPFMHAQVIPEAHELSPTITLDLHRHGGHVGFVSGCFPWRPRYWLEERIPNWLQIRMHRI